MTRQLRLLILASIALAMPVILTAQDSDLTPDPALVKTAEAAFPPELKYTAEQLAAVPGRSYTTCPALFVQNADGTPKLIATAYGGDGGQIAMLDPTPGRPTIVSSITNQQFWLTDGPCDLQLVDLADPEHPDSPLAKTIDATFGGGPDWFFIWNGEQLQNITALQSDRNRAWKGRQVPNSAMYSAGVVDIDHRGPMQIAGVKVAGDKFPDDDGISATSTHTVFRFNGTTYVTAKTLLFLWDYTPQPANWSEATQGSWADATKEWIDMHQMPKPTYQLRIVNGDRDGSNRVSSAKVEINGVSIVLPNEINQGMETLTRTIQLQKQNQIRVTVDGPEKSHLYVTVE